MRRTFAIATGIMVLLLAFHAQAADRHALIIGNSKYQHARTLINPYNDSADMASTLQKLFFKVTLLQDATREQMEKAVDDYIARLKENGGTGLFYYAGHGVQLEGNNYLVPVETKAGTEQKLKQQSYSIARLLNGIHSVKLDTNIIILDACRDNPFKNVKKTGRSLGEDKRGKDKRGIVKIDVPKLESGLSELKAPPNTLIAFATSPGEVASDGEGRNSPYTAELVRAMQNTGLTITEVFRQVREQVQTDTKEKQLPWESSSLIQEFYFKPRVIIPTPF